MDTDLQQTFNVPSSGGKYTETGRTIEVLDCTTGQIVIRGEGDPQPYTLKPLRELYGSGNGTDVVDPEDEIFMPLFLAIEEEIAKYDQTENPGLTDGTLALTLNQLGMEPEAISGDPLSQRIQTVLRLCLSLNNYSRQEVKAALRKINKSVDRHSRVAGRRGYLDFIVKFFGRR